MNILVLGGSYFLGKHFVNMACMKHDITVYNRGNQPLHLPRVSEVSGDRHDIKKLSCLKGKLFDVVVDFCAYQKNDIAMVFQTLEGSFSQYIYVSTCDVYKRGLGTILDENAPFEKREFGGSVGDYISGKVTLEEELMECGAKYHVAYTSIRPAFIYGPDNYAPREGIYFNWIQNAGQILHPVDATGEFQMVYVDDVALALLQTVGNEKAYNQVYNLAPLKMETYDSFSLALAESMNIQFDKVEVTVDQVNEKQIPLPFPLTKEESNWYDGSKALTLIGHYTELAEGLKKTVFGEEMA